MTAWLRFPLIIMSVGGGFAGVALTAEHLLNAGDSSTSNIVILIGGLAACLYVLVAGLIFTNNVRRVTPLAVALFLQIPVLYSPLITYRFGAGFIGNVAMTTSGGSWNVMLGCNYQFYLLQAHPWGFGVNLVALLMLIALSVSHYNDLARERQTGFAVGNATSNAPDQIA